MPAAPAHGLDRLFATLAQLTPAQNALLRRISQHVDPITVAELADESGLHPSSVRETLESLVEMQLVSGVKLPAQGRGRPATGYLSATDPDVISPASQMAMLTQCFFDWLQETPHDRLQAAHQIGALMGERAVQMMQAPTPVRPQAGSELANHMGKIRMLLTAFGMAAAPHPDHETAMVLRACPFAEGEPSPVALALRHSFVQRVIELTWAGSVGISVQPDHHDLRRCTVLLTPAPGQSEETTTVTYFGGAVDAAGCTSETYPSCRTLGELLTAVARRHPGLEPVLTVSTFLVGQRPAQRDQLIGPDASVEVLPPFAGG